MSPVDLGALALLVSGFFAATLAALRGPYTRAGLRMLLELWTAASLLHLTVARTALAIAAAACVVALRTLLHLRRRTT